MNTAADSKAWQRLRLWTLYAIRRLGPARSRAFATGAPDAAVGRIYVINLDRELARWMSIRRELRRMTSSAGYPLTTLTRRRSATDSRHLTDLPTPDVLVSHYTLADQLFVQPNPLLDAASDFARRPISMTRQEVAVACSHIDTWRAVADADVPYTLILEDDVYFTRTFARTMDRAWHHAMRHLGTGDAFDVLYLSYEEGNNKAARKPIASNVFTPTSGLWHLSGYVLSRRGARNLLDRLPVRGPVDLWLNHQFQHLNVLATSHSIIEQRPDTPTTNSYSILPILAQAGALTREKPAIVKRSSLPGPVLAFGQPGSQLTSLATALSTLGYRCCSDLADLPAVEKEKLVAGARGRVFNAYVNISSLHEQALTAIARRNRNARFIWTTLAGSTTPDTNHELVPTDPWAGTAEHLTAAGAYVLSMPRNPSDPWDLLSEFLAVDYPSHPYPRRPDCPPRHLALPTRHGTPAVPLPPATPLTFDASPWIVPTRQQWDGIRIQSPPAPIPNRERVAADLQDLDSAYWYLRDDTFPSNLALFRAANYQSAPNGAAALTLRHESTPVRTYTSAALATTHAYLYGRFAARLRPPAVPGLITGMFLHRNTPRQEIDIELLGHDTTTLLANVYYNPGDDGTKLEYGYRGTPIRISLGFDAATDVHQYAIEWEPDGIRWLVDDHVVHERHQWAPTPIPDQPMQFNINLWHSRSPTFAGKLDSGALPAHAIVCGVHFEAGR